MTLNPLEVAAAAGRLAGSFCETLLELIPRDEPTRGLDDDLDFDESAADRYLRELDCALGDALRTAQFGAPGPAELPLTDDELVAVRQLIEERFPLLAAPAADDVARTGLRPPAGDAPRADPIPSVGGAGRPNVTIGAFNLAGPVSWQLLSSAQRAITHWIGGASCTNTAHWQSVADELETAANELRDQNCPATPK